MGASLRLNPLDTSFVVTESRAAPNHVGGLLTFRLPDDAPQDFLRQLMHDFRHHREFQPPWNRRLKHAFAYNPVPSWIEDDDIDLEYHVRHAALPWPGGERELGELVGRLQSTPIDLARPPWECTLIEGLDERRFAMFIKIHHALIDGISGIKLLQRGMSGDREQSLKLPPFWAAGAATAAKARERGGGAGLADLWSAAADALRGQASTLPQVLAAFGKMAARLGKGDDGLLLPFDAPRTVLNGRVREKRRFATQQFPMARLRAVAAGADCTLNDVVLAVCAGALRRFLGERNALPEQTLTAGIPISVRPKDDEGGGNAISFIVARLGTDIEDPLERLKSIKASVGHAKAHVQGLSRQAMTQYTLLLMAPQLLTMITGTGARLRPMFNLTISNVPGPDKPLYFRGAQMLAIYPASIATHGQALNITCQSYAGQMNFGFTGCHSSVPSLQKLAVYAEEALQELEAALAQAARVAARKSTPRSAAPKKAAARPAAPEKAAPKRAAPTRAASKQPAASASAPKQVA